MAYYIPGYHYSGHDVMHECYVVGVAYKRPGYVIVKLACCPGPRVDVPESAVLHSEPIGHGGDRITPPCPRRMEGETL